MENNTHYAACLKNAVTLLIAQYIKQISKGHFPTCKRTSLKGLTSEQHNRAETVKLLIIYSSLFL